ncbi:MAG: acyl-CoA dehydratase activase-related protein [Syntrophaceticus sp.]|jgi:predicted nucleotide-binding protein (sugar kinase/HSP70/actin superfamily)
MVKVGIPRALFYYYYFPLWREFLQNLGMEVILSPETNKAILDNGVKATLSETCLPIKVFFGHVIALSDQVDYLFVPRITRVEPKAYICPKFMGLPDMLRARLQSLPHLIDTVVDISGDGNSTQCWTDCLKEVGSIWTDNKHLINSSIATALQAQNRFKKHLLDGIPLPDALEDTVIPEVAATSHPQQTIKIGVIGHPYNIYDPYISMNLFKKLYSLGVSVVTPESLAENDIEKKARMLPKKLFWTLGKRMIGSALNFLEDKQLDGLIYLTSFGCGPEALVEELVARRTKKQDQIPLMMLTIDEHTGEAGIITRLEAFTEMIKRRHKM